MCALLMQTYVFLLLIFVIFKHDLSVMIYNGQTEPGILLDIHVMIYFDIKVRYHSMTGSRISLW